MFRCIVIVFLGLFTTKGFSQIKVGEKVADLHITHWIANVPADTTLKGKLLVVDFWATWCAPCLAAVSHMNELAIANKNVPGLVFLSMTDEQESKVRLLLPKVHFSSVVVSDTTAETFKNFGISRIPFCALVDEHMEVKWAGEAALLSNDIIRQFVQRKEITAPAVKASTTSLTNRRIYDSLGIVYDNVRTDTSVKQYFNLGPLLNEGSGSRLSLASVVTHVEIVKGAGLQQELATLLGVSTTQVVLPPAMLQTYISYCYKGKDEMKPADLLQQIMRGLDLQSTSEDRLQEMMVLEVTDTSRLYADLPGPDDNISRISNADDGKFIALHNNTLPAMASALQEHFACMVSLKDADRFTTKINMTIMAEDFSKMETSMQSYGVKATKRKAPLKIYRFHYRSTVLNPVLL